MLPTTCWHSEWSEACLCICLWLASAPVSFDSKYDSPSRLQQASCLTCNSDALLSQLVHDVCAPLLHFHNLCTMCPHLCSIFTPGLQLITRLVPAAAEHTQRAVSTLRAATQMVNRELAHTAAQQGRDCVKQALAFQPVEVSAAVQRQGAVCVCLKPAAGSATWEQPSARNCRWHRLTTTINITACLVSNPCVFFRQPCLFVPPHLLCSQVIGDMAAPPVLPLGAVILYTTCLRAGDEGVSLGTLNPPIFRKGVWLLPGSQLKFFKHPAPIRCRV